MSVFWVFLGGGLGASTRFGLVNALDTLTQRVGWPFGVFLVNILGCFALGLCVPLVLRMLGQDVWAKLIIIGFLGGFTTFSTFAYDAVRLMQVGDVLIAGVYTIGSVIIGMLAVFIGLWLSQTIFG